MWRPMEFLQFSSVQSLSHVRLLATPWIAPCQASLSITNSRSSLSLGSIESVMPSSHHPLLPPSPPAPNPSQHQSLLQWVNPLHEMTGRISDMMLDMPKRAQKSIHFLRLYFPELWRLLLLVSPLICLWTLQGLGDTRWVLVERWDGEASGRVKSQLPSLGLGHVWVTTYIPSSLWKHAIASLSMTCMKSDQDLFYPFSRPASPETTLVSLGEIF